MLNISWYLRFLIIYLLSRVLLLKLFFGIHVEEENVWFFKIPHMKFFFTCHQLNCKNYIARLVDSKVKKTCVFLFYDEDTSDFHDTPFSFDQLANRELMDMREIGFHVKIPRLWIQRNDEIGVLPWRYGKQCSNSSVSDLLKLRDAKISRRVVIDCFLPSIIDRRIIFAIWRCD